MKEFITLFLLYMLMFMVLLKELFNEVNNAFRLHVKTENLVILFFNKDKVKILKLKGKIYKIFIIYIYK